MFDTLVELPSDPLLGLITQYQRDTHPHKIDLGVGVYRDASGLTPVLNCVKAAEKHILSTEMSKAYVGPAGNTAFSTAMADLVFGDTLTSIQSRLTGLQTPGGCGALRVIAETVMRAKKNSVLWVSDPTWANHIPLLGGAGLAISTYPYYDFEMAELRFCAMLEQLERANKGDIVLLHGCCHNPSGADLSREQWQAVIHLCKENELVPLIDLAYQGFGDSLDEDAFGVRLACEKLPEVLVAVSCSKNFGLYRERVGAAFVLSSSIGSTLAVASHMVNITRGIYSMPPSHGATIVETILSSQELNTQWHEELTLMRDRIQSVRIALADALLVRLGSNRFDFIKREKGMFSFLGIKAEQVGLLAKNNGIYMADSSRINLAGLNNQNLPYLVEAIANIL